jgi:hypothetical protein
MSVEYVGRAFVVEPDGDETEVRAALRIEADGWWGGWLIGPADWIAIASSTEPFVELRLPDGGRVGASSASSIPRRPTSASGLLGSATRRSDRRP